MLLVDSGNAANRADVLGVMYESMARMGYDAMGLGIMEAGLAEDVTRVAQEKGLPLVGTVGPKAGDAAPGRTSKQLGDLTVGIVGAGWTADPEAKTFRDTVRGLLEAARAESDFVVLLSQLGPEADTKLLSSEGFAGLADVVVSASDALRPLKPELVGQTVLLPGVRKGRELGVLEIALEGEVVRCHGEIITLVNDLPEDPDIAALVDKHYAERQEPTGGGQPVGGAGVDGPKLPDLFTAEEQTLIRARGYLTADECGRCHQEMLEQWETTPHSHALATLIAAERVVGECLVCHSEANRRGLPYDPEGADRHGVDCAACHGAGLFHASMDGAKDTIVRKPAEALCRRCHTAERDTGWALDLRLPKVVH